MWLLVEILGGEKLVICLNVNRNLFCMKCGTFYSQYCPSSRIQTHLQWNIADAVVISLNLLLIDMHWRLCCWFVELWMKPLGALNEHIDCDKSASDQEKYQIPLESWELIPLLKEMIFQNITIEFFYVVKKKFYTYSSYTLSLQWLIRDCDNVIFVLEHAWKHCRTFTCLC